MENITKGQNMKRIKRYWKQLQSIAIENGKNSIISKKETNNVLH